MGKVSHEKTRIATRSVNHACNIAMPAFLLFLLLDSDEFVGVWIPRRDQSTMRVTSRCLHFYSFYSWIPTSLWVSGFLDSDEFVGVWIPLDS